MLQQVAAAIETIPDRRQQSNLVAAAGILAGLVLDKRLIQRLMRRDLMQESVIYQEWREEARAEARSALYQELREEAKAEAHQELLAEGRRAEGRSLVLRLLNRKVGELPDEVRSQVDALSLPQLESLGEALLDFSNLPDLTHWLAQN